jgi:hypothetical protein
VILAFWPTAFDFYVCLMSENVRSYQQKMAALRVSRRLSHPLRDQLRDILGTVAVCEARWALEDRIERQIGRG